MKIIKTIIKTILAMIFVSLAALGLSTIWNLGHPANTIILCGALGLCAFGIAVTYYKEPKEMTYVLEKICPECGESLYLTYDLPEDENEARIYYYACDKCEFTEEIELSIFKKI